jgi:hypothetical protein
VIPPSASQILALADAKGWQSCGEKTRKERSDEGQFFTPPPIARCLAGWFAEEGFNRSVLHLLDPGAGGGVLTAALVERIVSLRAAGSLPRLEAVILEAWELDSAFLPALQQGLSACVVALEQAGIRAEVQLCEGSYIEGAVRGLDPRLFGAPPVRRVTHAILNPPYRKIATSSRERRLLASAGIETSNLYAAFVALALRQLEEGASFRRSPRAASATAPISASFAVKSWVARPFNASTFSTPAAKPLAGMRCFRRTSCSTWSGAAAKKRRSPCRPVPWNRPSKL